MTRHREIADEKEEHLQKTLVFSELTYVADRPPSPLAILCEGAYGMSMSSNYNSRPRAAEIMVNGSEKKLITDRETREDLVRKERM